ncbi:MAG: alpha/beta hydrolase [Rhodobacteraceae bacterium]|nr:alpha/beta hydrolase [Paracoccaceae bacterium]
MPPLILLPGMMCDARLYGPQIAEFSGLHALHLAPIGAQDTVEKLAADILRDAPPSFALVGLSMGGIVAMEVLRQAPDRVAKIALLDTNPLAEKADVKKRRAPQMAKVLAGGLRAVMQEEMKPNYLAPGGGKKAILDLCLDMAEGLGSDVFLRQSRALMGRRDQTETLRGAQQPALIMCGRHDLLCPVERHQLMRDLMPNATLVVVDNAGHLPTLEQPTACNAALTQWLEA